VRELRANSESILRDVPDDDKQHALDAIVGLTADLVNPYKFTMPDILASRHGIHFKKVGPEYSRDWMQTDDYVRLNRVCSKIIYRIHNDFYLITGKWCEFVPGAMACLVEAQKRIGYIGELRFA
jgi:hypothetical protein